MFRVLVSTREAFGFIRHEITLQSNFEKLHMVGVITLKPAEWIEFLRICEAQHIEVRIADATVPVEASEAAEAR